MLNQSHRRTLLALIVPLLVGVVLTQRVLDPQIRKIHANERTPIIGMSNEFILGPMLGLQQAVAGALWVRADEFFHEGDYDAILPIVRMVTYLDPHQLDVYITGAWHLAYNFTDANERSDRRYIPAAQALLVEGDRNNNQVYDIAFELGWELSDKIKNYDRAEEWYRIATQRHGIGPSGKADQEVPMFVWHQLAHGLERQGRIDECIQVWKQCLAMTGAKLKKAGKKEADLDYTLRNTNESEKHNLELTLKRKYSRYVHEIDFDVDAKRTRSFNMETGEPTPPDAYLSLNPKVDKVPLGTPRRPAVVPPWDTAFNVRKIWFPQPEVMMIDGQFNVGDGARVTIRLHDDDWHEKQMDSFTFDIDQQQTIMQDQHSVRAGRWGRKIDMSKDPKMYSFSRPYYYVVFWFDSRGTSPFIQDKFGWSGEGLDDRTYPQYLKTIPPTKPGVPPNRILRKVYKISRDQIMGNRPVTEADVVSNEEYDRFQRLAKK
jgi:hypothetical protein